MRVAATLGRDVVGDEQSNAIDDIARLRAELDARPSPSLRVRAGADVQIDRLRPGAPPEGSTGGPAVAPSRDAAIVGMHADAAWRVARNVELTPGLRADVYSSTVHAAPGVPLIQGTVGGSSTPVLGAAPRRARSRRDRRHGGVDVRRSAPASHDRRAVPRCDAVPRAGAC